MTMTVVMAVVAEAMMVMVLVVVLMTMMTIMILIVMIDYCDDDDDIATLADDANQCIRITEGRAAQHCLRSRRQRPRLISMASGCALT